MSQLRFIEPRKFATARLGAAMTSRSSSSSRRMVTTPTTSTSTESPGTLSSNRNRVSGRPKNSKPKTSRPTHFLSMPLGHHSGLRDKIQAFHDMILPPGGARTAVATDGLDPTILVDPRRLHLTLGVMALSLDDPTGADASQDRQKTLSDAIQLLQSLAPEINAITRNPAIVSLDQLGVLKVKGQQAGVLWVGPSDKNSEDTLKIHRIFDLVVQRFRREGFIEETRPPLLHCTLINASHRKPRIPRLFSYLGIFERVASLGTPVTHPSTSNALTSGGAAPSILSIEADAPGDAEHANNKTLRIDFGAWAVPEIQLCKMGSYGPDNEYISCASVSIGDV
ncbi:AKAP7 2'5' RNA ligase-like domain-containing protein [Mycena rebaudengoi]|nr:AKAP7 2'5' RNA ligase-like domain-containing protein [Mycena rebaudengoi]KAJ7244954.1 AKAP7 2'5' RNA ligase-like domain-containing protein [Mycena rebaudengoi]